VILAGELDYMPARIVTDSRLYAASPEILVEIIGALDDGLACVMVVGHNPELTDLAHRFSAEITDMPTGAVAAFDFDVAAWSEMGDAEPVGMRFDYPKNTPDQ
jgi:phosphohistidine phosphatase